MSDSREPMAQAIGQIGAEGETVDSLAARLPAFPREAVQDALTMLTDAGVLRKEADANGLVRYFLANPSRYKLADMDVIRRPDGATGRRGR